MSEQGDDDMTDLLDAIALRNSTPLGDRALLASRNQRVAELRKAL